MKALILVLSILLAVLHNANANFIEDMDTGVIIGIAAGAGILLIALIILVCFCFGCACFATGKAVNAGKQITVVTSSSVPRDQKMGHITPQHRSVEPGWENQAQVQSQQQQYMQQAAVVSRNSSSLESQNRPQSLQPQSPVHEQSPPSFAQAAEQPFQPSNYPASPDPHNSYPPSYPTSPQPNSSYPSSPQPHMYTANPPTQMDNNYPNGSRDPYYPNGQEYPIFQDQYPANTPMTRVNSEFRYPDGLILELKTDGNKKLKPPPPPKPIKIISQVQDVPPPDY